MSPFEYSRRYDKDKQKNTEEGDGKPARKQWGQKHQKNRPAPNFGQIIEEVDRQQLAPAPPNYNKVVQELDRRKVPPPERRKKRIRLSRSDSGSFDPVEVAKYMGGLLKNEEIRRVYYRHWVEFFYKGWLPSLLFLPLIGLFLLFLRFGGIFPVIGAILLLFEFIALLWFWFDYRDDRLIVTNIRIVQSERTAFLRKDSTEIRLEKAQEVRLQTNRGLVEWMFKIGTITITSIGKAKIIFNRVQYPENVRREIDEVVLQWRFRNRDERKQRTAGRIEKRLRAYYEGTQEQKKEAPPEPKMSFWQTIFPTRKQESYDEKGRLVLTWHTHPWILIKNVFWRVLLLLLIILVYLFPLQWWVFKLNIDMLNLLLWIIFPIVLIFMIIRILLEWENWRNDRYIIKVDELLTMKKLPFGFDESVGVIKLFNAQDVQSDKPGFMANILDFGTVTVTAAGAGEPLKFVNVPDPEDIEEEISSRIEGAKILREDLEDNLTMEAIYNFFEKNELMRKRYNDGRQLYGDNP